VAKGLFSALGATTAMYSVAVIACGATVCAKIKLIY
jgi:hypothetical protein